MNKFIILYEHELSLTCICMYVFILSFYSICPSIDDPVVSDTRTNAYVLSLISSILY